jgi:hypothetical protein
MMPMLRISLSGVLRAMSTIPEPVSSSAGAPLDISGFMGWSSPTATVHRAGAAVARSGGRVEMTRRHCAVLYRKFGIENMSLVEERPVRHFVSPPHGWHEKNFHKVMELCHTMPEPVQTDRITATSAAACLRC